MTPLGEGVLVLRSMEGNETFGSPFKLELVAVCADPSAVLADLLGQPVSVSLELTSGNIRYFHGLVSQVGLIDAEHDVMTYRIRVNPWLSMLGHRTNCRVFQHKSVVQIAELLFREHGYSDFEERLAESYPPLEYVVQYRESDLAFVSRLFEQAGIYYFFAHEETKHTLVLADSLSAHDAAVDYETLPFRPPDAHRDALVEHVRTWQVLEKLQSGAVAARDFNFETSRADMSARLKSPEEHVIADGEWFDFPGGYSERAIGDAVVRRQLEILSASNHVVNADTNARGLLVGSLFALTEHPLEAANKEYLVTSATYLLSPHDPRASDTTEAVYSCRFTAADSARVYRPARTTPKPVARGLHTAFVVGKEGEEIWTDEYGRVKVQFHWDRYGELNEDSSCWVRVSQAWAGGGWGSMHIPRIGQEVIVDFIEGDPDRPIITGRVYNNVTKVPYTLPANQTQSGIKSRSTKGGNFDNFNELRFEDKKGEEELYIQAEKNMTTLVKNDQSTSVIHNRSASVGGNDSVSVTGDRSVSVHGNLSVTVEGTGQSPIHSSHSVTGKHNLHASDTIDMDAPTHIQLVCGGSSITIEPGKITLTAGGQATVVLDANVLAKAAGGGNILIDANVCATGKASGSVLVDANVRAASAAGHSALVDAKGVTLTAGGSTITETTSSVAIVATTVNASGGPSGLELAGAGATLSGPKVTVSGAGTTEITGSLVKIN